jgi:hypothetical protein
MTGVSLRDPLFEDLFDFRREFDKVFTRMLAIKPWGKEGDARRRCSISFHR